MMPNDQSIRKLLMQLFQQLTERSLLLRRPGVNLVALNIEATLVTDTDTVFVMTHDMSPRLRESSALLDGAVTTHHEMIADALPVDAMRHTLFVPFINIVSRTGLVRPDTATVYY
jgi:hypothetical protein